MLGTLRKSASGFVAKIFLGLLALSFAVWGMGDITRGGKAQAVATVGGEEIFTQDLKQAIDDIVQQSRGNITAEMIRSLKLYNVKLNDLINQTLLSLEAKRLGIRVSEEELIGQIQDLAVFKDNSGSFDKSRFREVLRQSGISEAEFFASTTASLERSVLVNSMPASRLVNDDMLDQIYRIKHEQREVLLGLIGTLPETEKPEADPSELEAFYQEHKHLYKAPEYRRIAYVLITPEDINRKITISREELFALYQQRIADYKVAEKRDIEQLLYASKAEAENAYTKLIGGTSFEEVSTLIAPINAGNLTLGEMFQDQMTSGAEKVFALAQGEYTPPIQSPFGWHIYSVKNIIEEHAAPFESVSDALEEELVQDKANSLLTSTQEQFEDALASGMNLKEAAETQGLVFTETAPLDRYGNSHENEALLDPQKQTPLLQTAFSLNKGDTSPLKNDTIGNLYIVKLLDIVAERDRAYQEVSGQVLEDWKKKQHYVALEAYANKQAQQLAQKNQKAPNSLSQNMSAMGIGSIENITMDTNGIPAAKLPAGAFKNALNEAMVKDIFSLPNNGATTKAYSYNGGFAIASLGKTLPAPARDSKDGKATYAALKRALEQSYNEALDTAYLEDLRKRYPVTIHHKVIEAAFGGTGTEEPQ